MEKPAEDPKSEDTSLRGAGYRLEYQGMYICPTCYELYEKQPVNGIMQRCSCGRHCHEPRWSGYDFNQKALLCRCCGLQVLRSGSRWSPFFCRECQLMAMGVSVWHQRLIFPTGRHSHMHTWVPRAVSPTLAAHRGSPYDLSESVATTLGVIANAQEGLWLWYRQIMARNLERFKLHREIDLRTFLLAAMRAEIGLSTRIEAFDGLCEFFRTIPSDKRGN